MRRRSVDLNRLMWLGLGAGSKGAAAGIVTGWLPEVGITPDLVAAGIGFGLANYGGDRLGTFGEGMLIAAIGQMCKEPIENLFAKFKGNQTGTKTTTKLTEETASSAGGSTTTEQYLTQKYGIKVA